MSEAFATMSLDRERAFKRMLALSAGVHLALLLGFMLKPPRFEEPSPLPAVVALVDASELEQLMAPAKPAKPTPAPVPEPEAAQPEPPPEPEKIVIPEDNQRKPEQRKPERTRERTPEPPRELEQVDFEDLLNEAREEVGAGPAVTAKPKGPRVDGPTGPGIVDPERARWQEKVRAHIRRRWDLQPGFRGKGLSTEVVVTLSASGQIFGFEIRRSSGNPWFDESVDRYLSDESELPAPPRGDDWSIIFDGDY